MKSFMHTQPESIISYDKNNQNPSHIGQCSMMH